MASFVAPAMSSFAAARLEKERIAILARRTEFMLPPTERRFAAPKLAE